MRRRSLLKLAALCLLLWFPACWPAAKPPPARTVRPLSAGQPVEWAPLAEAMRLREAWYTALPPATTTPPATPPPARRSGTVSVAARRGTHRGYATTAECIGMVENGGDYGRSSNPSHFGRYQYDRQTWAAHGGDPDTWGSASPEEQDRVFANGTAQYGYSAWTPYDGC